MSYKTIVPIPAPSSMNSGYSALKVSTLESIFGDFGRMPEDCGTVTNAKIKRLVETRNVGPFTVTGLTPALDSLVAIFNEVKHAHPDLYALLGTEGMLCWRHVRGVPNAPSNHASGLAIDISIGGILPELGSHHAPMGLVVLYGYFHAHGWYDGMGYKNGRPDAMHKEVADETVRGWHRAGRLD